MVSAAVICTEQRLQFLSYSCFPPDSGFVCSRKGRHIPQHRNVHFAVRKGMCGF